MNDRLARFERVVRRAGLFTEARSGTTGGLHPFDEHNIHSRFPYVVRQLFDDGHYAQASFEAYKFVDKEVQRFSGCSESGFKLMMKAFNDHDPPIKLTLLTSETDRDEQKGFQFLFAGSILAIRNPRGQEPAMVDSPDKCLDHLGLASLLLRRLEEAGFK